MSNTNIIFFGYEHQLVNKIIEKIVSFFNNQEKIHFSQKQKDNIDDIEDIVVYESEEPDALKLIDITNKTPEAKRKIFEFYKNSKQNNIFVWVVSHGHLFEEQDNTTLKYIHTIFKEVSLNSFFCILDRRELNEDEDNTEDLKDENEYFAKNLEVYFKTKLFEIRQQEEDYLLKGLKGSVNLDFFTELKNCWEQLRQKENREEEKTNQYPKTEESEKKEVEKNVSYPLNQLSPLIDNIIEQRGKQVRVIARDIENINQIDRAIKELRDSLDNLLQHPQVTEELKSRLQEFGSAFTSFGGEIVSVLDQLENVKKRLARQAVTIGCSGQARVGKSTLLQTIGNLPEEAIPTGKGIPVTAVRSRLRHSHEHKAILSLRDKRNFIDEIVKPFHRELNLSIVNSFEDFRNFDYNSKELATDKNVELLGRLKQMQAALSSYEKHLTGTTKKIEDLTKLRSWVAYPKQEEEIDPNCSRLYLAVKNIEIQCSFLLDVEKLILVDLPGLGEVNVDAEEHHIQGLKNEVDLVLLILRPTAQSSYWGDKDRKALNLISQAVEGISRLGDFVIIVINSGEKDDKELYQILINDVHKQLNEKKPDSRYRVLTCDAIDSNSVREEVLEPVLNHLITRLPVMDKEIIDSNFTRWQAIVEKISITINELETFLGTFPSQVGSMQANVYDKAKLLREELAVKLGKEIRELRKEIQAEKDEGTIIDNKLIEEIEKKHQQIQTWAKNGLGKGKEEWYKKARGRFNIDKTVDAFIIEEINRARAYLTDIYSQLDVYFETKIDYLWRQISNIISGCTGNLIKETPAGKEALEKFLLLLEGKGVGDPFPSLREATEYLLKCGVENAIFQSHLLPRLIEETQKLSPENLIFTNISYEDAQAEKIVLEIISGKLIQTSYAVQKTLRQKPFVSDILYSAFVKFEDSLVRSTDADRQFFNFALSYTNEIWTGEFQAIENNHALVKITFQAVNNLKQLLNNSLKG